MYINLFYLTLFNDFIVISSQILRYATATNQVVNYKTDIPHMRPFLIFHCV